MSPHDNTDRALLDETRLRAKHLCGELMAAVDTAETYIAVGRATRLKTRIELNRLAGQLADAVRDHGYALPNERR